MAHALPPKQSTGPVIVVVFEGIPESSLLRAPDDLDAARFPGFAALATHSTWVRGTTTVATRALDAVPAILTGRYPTVERTLPIHANHPINLLTLLADRYRINDYQSTTLLLPPERAGERLPGTTDPQVAEIRELRKDTNRPKKRPEKIRRFSGSIAHQHRLSTLKGMGSVHFLHVLFPEAPWRFTADGTRYRPDRFHGSFAEIWSEEAWWTESAFRRHILQLQLVDRLLGELIAGLAHERLFDDSLLVVTSAFGAGFWPGQSRRSAEPNSHPEDVLSVPLFVKRPGQREGAVIRRVSETVDILPTILGALGEKLPEALDGCALFDARCPRRTKRTTLLSSGQGDRRIAHFENDIVLRRETLDRKLALTGVGNDTDPMFRFGPYAGLVGRKLDTLEVGTQSAGLVRSHRQGPRWSRGERGPRFVGLLEPATPGEPTPHVAFAFGGRIVTVVPAPHDRNRGRVLVALLPEPGPDRPPEPIALLRVEGDPASPRLSPLALEER
jgi:hypothetical protein